MQNNLPKAYTQLVTKLGLKSKLMRFYPYPLLDPCFQSLPGLSTLLPFMLLLACSLKNPSGHVSFALRHPMAPDYLQVKV